MDRLEAGLHFLYRSQAYANLSPNLLSVFIYFLEFFKQQYTLDELFATSF